MVNLQFLFAELVLCIFNGFVGFLSSPKLVSSSIWGVVVDANVVMEVKAANVVVVDSEKVALVHFHSSGG